MEDYDGKEADCKLNFYKQEIIDVINGIERLDTIEYLHYFIKAKVKAE